MMKKLFYLLLLSVALLAACNKDDDGVIPDDEDKIITADFDISFAKVLQEKGYISDASHITSEDVKHIVELIITGESEDRETGKGLTSLKGIEHFKSLQVLICAYNQLTSLNLEKNTALTFLRCRENQLTALDVTKNTGLTYLDCSSNQLTALDVTKNTGLTRLDCPFNQLTALDVTKNAGLTYLECTYNQLTALDVTKNTGLIQLHCSYNPGSEGIFPVTVWPEENGSFDIGKETWEYEGEIIIIEKRKAQSASARAVTAGGGL